MDRKYRQIRRGVAAIALASLTLVAPTLGAQDTSAAAARWWHHITVLAADSLHGRRVGTADYVEAAHYVAGQFSHVGLKPGGTDGYYQQVTLAEARLVPEQSSIVLMRGQAADTLRGIPSIKPSTVAHAEGSMVFLGYGLNLPGAHDDLAGVDLRGKVAVYLNRMPEGLNATMFAHGRASRWRELQRLGAVAAIAIADPLPPGRARRPGGRAVMGLADDPADRGILVNVSGDSADQIFNGSGHTYAELAALSDAHKTLPTFDLVPRLVANLQIERTPVEAPNVVGILMGSDPVLRNQYVIVSAHLDHLGVGRPVNGDSIYNGAMDNASGIATLIETAGAFHDGNVHPRRSVIFLAVTGEEEGELGSAYFALHPTVPASGVVADLNTDMYLPIIPLTGIFAYGWDESNLGAEIMPVLKKHNLVNLPDPEPEQVRFIRSDQYSFIQRGIPALAFKAGYTKGSPEMQTVSEWLKNRYHKPSDDLQQPVNLKTAVEFDSMYFDMIQAIADSPAKPAWYSKSVFSTIPRAGSN